MRTHLLVLPFIVGVSSFTLSSCNSKEKQAEIEKLNEELELTRQSIETEMRNLDLEREDKKDLVEENNQLRSELRGLENRAKSAERDLERIKEREMAAKVVKERVPTSGEKREAAAKAAAEHLHAIVTITGDQSSGSGTLVSADDKTWIYFPADVVIGNTRLEITTSDGTKLGKFGNFEIASDANLARLELKDEVEGALVPSAAVEIEGGFPLLGVGDSDTILDARTYEVSAEEVNGGSRFRESAIGTPVFSGESAELLGILAPAANDMRTLWPQRVGANDARVVCRLDRSIKWTPLAIATLMEEAKVLAEADRFTRLVLAFSATRPSTTGVSLGSPSGSSVSTEKLLEEYKTVASVKALFALDEWLKEKGARAASADLERQSSGVYGDLLRTSKRSTKTLSSTNFSDYHSKAAAQSLEWRKDAEEKLGKVPTTF